MPLFDQLFPATLNGVPFLVDTSDTTFGRKTKTFEYPNKKYRHIEDLGENLRTFTIDAVITGDDDYLILREAFILALQHQGTSVLTHPFYGLVFVTVKNYTISEKLTTLGECKFNITFEEARQNIYPIAGDEGVDSILSLVNGAAPFLEAFFITKFVVTFKHNIADASDKSVKFNSSLQPTKPVDTLDNSLNDFAAQSKSFNDNRYLLIQDSTDYGSAISNLIVAYDNLGKDASDSYIMDSNVYYCGIDDVPVKEDTGERIERVSNRKVFNSYINALLLINLYLNAVQIVYLDDQQILTMESDLEEKYQYLMDNNVLDIDSIRQLETLRSSTKKFFNQLKTNISKVITVHVNTVPLSVLLYRFYANFDNENEIISLNNINNTTQIDGDIKILTAA